MSVDTLVESLVSNAAFDEKQVVESPENLDVQIVGSNYVTVSIPDLRKNRTTPDERPQFRFDGAHEPRFTDSLSGRPEVGFVSEDIPSGVPTPPAVGAISNLKTIKESIERSFNDGNVDQFNREVDLEQLAEQLADRTDEAEISDDGKAVEIKPRVANVCLKEFDQVDSQVEAIATSINDLQSKNGCTIVALACSETNDQLASVLIGTAKSIGDKTNGRTLIIDSDFSSNNLTKIVKSEKSKGFSEMASTKADVHLLVAETSIDAVDFVSAGQKRIQKFDQCAALVERVIPSFVSQYDCILVNVGDAHDKAAKIWSRYTNGSYLLVSMQNSNQEIAKSAVSQLNSVGARLIGCIASDNSTE